MANVFSYVFGEFSVVHLDVSGVSQAAAIMEHIQRSIRDVLDSQRAKVC